MGHDASYRTVAVGESELSFVADDGRHTFARARLPEPFLRWLVQGRNAMYDLLEGRGQAHFFGSHLPVVVTYARNASFPFNTGNKGIGLLPQAQRLAHYCELYRSTVQACARDSWHDSLASRLRVVRGFVNGEDVSNEGLVSLEIFEQTTFSNLCDFPIATLHYTGEGPLYRSFQINAVVQIVPPENPTYEFAYLSRRLFEFDDFHITQTRFPYAYLFYPVEVRDKTPFPRHEDAMPATPHEWAEMALTWDGEVLEQLVRAPTFIQRFIIRVTEEYARKEGCSAVSLALFERVRAQYAQKTKNTTRPNAAARGCPAGRRE